MRSVQTANGKEAQPKESPPVLLVWFPRAPAWGLRCARPAPGGFGPFSAATVYEKELPAPACRGPPVARST